MIPGLDSYAVDLEFWEQPDCYHRSSVELVKYVVVFARTLVNSLGYAMIPYMATVRPCGMMVHQVRPTKHTAANVQSSKYQVMYHLQRRAPYIRPQ